MARTIVMITLLAVTLAGCSGADVSDEPAATNDSAAAADATVSVPQQDVAVVGGEAGSAGLAAVTTGEADGVAAGITVSGAGQASGAPDVVRVTVGVRVVRETVDEALDAANAATEQVLAALDDAGIAAEDRQTRDFSINPEYGGDSANGGPQIVGYAVSNLVEAKIRQVDRAGAILTAVADAGGDATRIQGVSFALEDDGEQVAAAREAAFADARARAEQYAELAGVSLGGLIGITDVTVSTPRPAETLGAEAARADSPVPIEPGAQQVTVSVTVRWALES